MTIVPVESSMIDWVSYDEEKNMLTVRFLRGGIYTYEDVSVEEYDGFMSSPSKGGYFSKNIKNKVYKRVGD